MNCEIAQKNKRLALGIKKLATELGFNCSFVSKIATMKRADGSIYRGEVFRMVIFGDLWEIPMRVKRKRLPKVDKHHKNRKNPLRSGFSVEPQPDQEYIGLVVDSDKLYLHSDCQVTHNTKPKEVADIYVRHEVNLKCVFRNNRKIGLLRKTSTVEEMDKGGNECRQIWDYSDPEVRNENGQTLSWLYRYGVYVQETDQRFADKFGIIDTDRKVLIPGIKQPIDVLSYYLNARRALEHDHNELASYCRKNPMDERDFFIKKPGTTTFNTMAINAYKTKLLGRKKLWISGNFRWSDEKKPFNCPVIFERDDHSGKWQLAWLPDKEGDPFMHMVTTKLMNNVTFGPNEDGKRRIIPHNNHVLNFGIDPIKDVKTKDPRSSKMSSHIFMRYNALIDKDKAVEDWYTYRFVGRYNNRPDDPSDAYQDVAMGMLYFGCWCNLFCVVLCF